MAYPTQTGEGSPELTFVQGVVQYASRGYLDIDSWSSLTWPKCRMLLCRFQEDSRRLYSRPDGDVNRVDVGRKSAGRYLVVV